jgi:DNA-binding LacI/PurR family transcriptional regulator
MTVSRVVTGNGYVSSELRRKIERVIARIGYSPNRLARSLKGASTKTIGVLLPDLGNPFSADLASGIEEILLNSGYYPFVVSAGAGTGREEAGVQGFIDHRVAGAILATRCSTLDRAAISDIARKRFPVVVVGPEFDGEEVDHVIASYRRGGFEAAEHLIASGRRRIAFIGSTLDNRYPMRRFQGYLDALKEYGLKPDRTLAVQSAKPGSWGTHRDGYECMNQLLDLKKRPDAVFARNDYAAAGALRAMRERGVSVPDEIAIVGFDNVSSTAYSTPPLTTVNQFAWEQGKRAAGLLTERIDATRRYQPREELFTCELVVRESSALKAMAA